MGLEFCRKEPSTAVGCLGPSSNNNGTISLLELTSKHSNTMFPLGLGFRHDETKYSPTRLALGVLTGILHPAPARLATTTTTTTTATTTTATLYY